MKVTHQIAQHRFLVRLPGGKGELLYGVAGPHLLDLYHTEVSPPLRGRGIASRLVTAACEYARETRQKVIPSCPYIADWFDKNPDQQDLLVGS